MNRFVRRAYLLFALLSVVEFADLQAQEAAPDLATAYEAAMADFQAGNYAKAAGALEALVARVEVTPQVEPIFYTIGSAYFNAGEYPKAIAAFKNYQAKFPKGPHAGGAAFAIAQSNLLEQKFQGSGRANGGAGKSSGVARAGVALRSRSASKRPGMSTARSAPWKN